MSDSPWRHPRPLFALVAVAACEWLAYYALRNQMVLELDAALGDQGAAIRLYQVIGLAFAIAPALAGVAVDLAGARRMALVGAALTAAGLVTAALPAPAALYAGIALVVAGKPLAQIGLLALVGDLYAPGDRRRDAGFTLFWLGINAGSAASSFLFGLVAAAIGTAVGFAAAGALAMVGAIVLAAWRPPPAPAVTTTPWPAGRALGSFAALLVATLGLTLARETEDMMARIAMHGWPVAGVEGLIATVQLAVLVVATATTVLLLPVLVAWVWLRLGPRQPSSPAKILLGALVTAAGIVWFRALPLEELPGLSAELLSHTSAILADLFIVPIVMAMVSGLAPPRWRGTALGLWSTAVAFLAYPSLFLQGRILEHELAQIDAFLPVLALTTGAVGYALLAVLGQTRTR